MPSLRHPRSVTPRRVRRARRGLTLVELLVALAVLSAGLLALAAATASALHRLADARLDDESAWRAAARFERLRATSCGARTAGQASAAGLVERWTVAYGADSTTMRLADTLVASTGRTRGFAVEVPC